MTAKKKAETTWVHVPKPIDATELFELRDRLGKMLEAKGKDAPKQMQGVVMYRLAVDCDHLARLMDAGTGTKRMTFNVFVKDKPKKKRAVNKGGDRS